MSKWAKGIVIAAVTLVAAPGASASPLTHVSDLVAPATGEALTSSAISGTTLFTGAPHATFTAQDQGAVFAFAQPAPGSGATEHETAVLTATSPVAGDELGTSVQAEGNTVIATASNAGVFVFVAGAGGFSGTVHQSATLLPSGGGHVTSAVLSGSFVVASVLSPTSTRSVVVFAEPSGGWSGTLSPSATLVASDGTPDDDFGQSIAADGGTIVVGAPQAQGVGAAYVFTAPAGGWSGTVTESAKLTGSDVRQTDPLGLPVSFGWSVAIAGTTVAVTLPSGQDTLPPAQYVFVEPPGGWHSETQQAKLVASGASLVGGSPLATGDQLAMSPTTVVVPGDASAPSPNVTRLYVFAEPAGGWSGTLAQSATLAASDGASLTSAAIAGQTVFGGGSLAASAQAAVSAQPVYAFTEPAGGWAGQQNETARLAPSASAPVGTLAAFTAPPGGWTSAGASAELVPSGETQPVVFTQLAADGQTAVASDGAEIDVFSAPNPAWSTATPAATLTDSAGEAVYAIAVSGSTVVAITRNSSYRTDGVDVFTEPSGGWAGRLTQSARLLTGALDPSTVAIDGPIVAAGSYNTGEVFTEPAGGWGGTVSPAARLAPTPHDRAIVPAPVIGVQGSTVLVGAAISGQTALTIGQGAYVYTMPAGGWSGTRTPSARLQTWNGVTSLFTQPAGGWSGTILPTVHFPGTASAAAIDGATIALTDVVLPLSRYYSCPCRANVDVLTRPASGWSGLWQAPSVQSLTSIQGEAVPVAVTANAVLLGGQPLASLVTTEIGTSAFDLTGPVSESRVAVAAPTAHLTATGLHLGRPRIVLALATAVNGPPVASVTIAAPRGMRFTAHVRAGVRSPATPTARLAGGRLALTFVYDPAMTTIVLSSPTLVESASLRRRLDVRHPRRHRRLTLRFGVRIVDAAGHAITRTIVLRVAIQ